MICELYDGYTCNIIFNKTVNLAQNDTRIRFTFNNSTFNSKVVLPDGLENLYLMFYGGNIFNAPVILSNNATNCRQMFGKAFNQPVNIPNKVEECSYMFVNCRNFNSPVVLKSNVLKAAYRMFENCSNFNQSISFPSRVGADCSFYRMFSGCSSFNKPVSIPNGVVNCGYMFNMCESFDSPVTIPSSVDYCEGLFAHCNSFNQPVVFPLTVKSTEDAFAYCGNYNCPIYIPDSAETFAKVEMGSNYASTISYPYINKDITGQYHTYNSVFSAYLSGTNMENHIGLTVISREDAFVDVIKKWRYKYPDNTYGRNNFATEEIIELMRESGLKNNYIVEYLEDAAPQLEGNPPYFNDPNYNGIPDLTNLKNCSYYYKDCKSYNQAITIPNTVLKADGMFAGCHSFNKPITFEN